MNTPVVICVELCTSHVGANANPRHYADHFQEFIQCLSNVPLPVDVTVTHNQASVELLEWLRDKKQLKAIKGGKKIWSLANLEQDRHREGEFPRISGFEVFILSTVETEKGLQQVIQEAYSKLHHDRWPTVPLLVQKIVKILSKIKKRDHGFLSTHVRSVSTRGNNLKRPGWHRCTAVFLESIGKLFDCHSHPPGMTTGSLFIPSMKVWVHPDVEGELLPASYTPDGAKTMQLCDLTPGMRVRAVNLRNCDIKYSNSKEISAYVAKTTSLHALCLRDNDIDAQAATHFANAVAVNPAITSLDLRNNRIGPDGGTALALVLRTNHSIRQMNLYGNGLGGAGGEAIANALKRNTSLTVLDLGDNHLGDLSSTKIANALRSTSTLTSLQIQPLNDLHPGSSGMGDPRLASGCVALVEGLRENPVMHTLNVGASSILSQWDPAAGRFPHKMMTPSLWKGKATAPPMAATGAPLNCTRTALLPKPKSLRHALVPHAKNDSEAPKKPLLATEYAAKRNLHFKSGVGGGRLGSEVLAVHQMALESLAFRGPRLIALKPLNLNHSSTAASSLNISRPDTT